MKNFKEMVYGNLFEAKKKAKKKGKYDDGDGKDEKCDYVPCKDRLDEEEVEIAEELLEENDPEDTDE